MKLGLRGKYALGFGVLLALLLGLAAASLLWLSRLGGSVHVILQENYRSVVAAQEMKEALERMDSGALFALTGDAEQGRTLVRVHAPAFEQALDDGLSNITLPGERERAERLQELFADFRGTLDRVMEADRPLEARRELYFSSLLPTFQEMKTQADEILQANQENMVAASARAEQLAARGRQQMLVLSVIGVLVGVVCVVYLSRSTLFPVRRLTQSVREIAEGQLDLAVDVRQGDEIGELADAFNTMTARLRELRRTDRARLLRAERTSSMAINSLRDAVFLIGPDGLVELANRVARSLLGVVQGRPLPDRHRDWLEPLTAEAESGGGYGERSYGDAIQFFVDGRERFYVPRAVAIFDDEAKVLGVTVILSDVTELRQLDEMRNDLLAAVSHELMTPVTSLGMGVHVLLRERAGELSEPQAELLRAAQDDVERLQAIIEGVLDVSRLEEGASPLDREPLAPCVFVHAAVEAARATYEDKGVELLVDLDDGVPAVLADRGRISLVLANLLTNALRHTPAGATVTVRARPVGARVRFTVSDTGSGIPAHETERVFEKFHQLPGTEGGVGLGLAIAREIVEAHEGRIWCESAVGDGSDFIFDLPKAPAPVAEPNDDPS